MVINYVHKFMNYKQAERSLNYILLEVAKSE